MDRTKREEKFLSPCNSAKDRSFTMLPPKCKRAPKRKSEIAAQTTDTKVKKLKICSGKHVSTSLVEQSSTRSRMAGGPAPDISFIYNGERLDAHKCVLVSHGSHFQTLFDGPLAPFTPNEIDVSGKVTDWDVFVDIIDSLYSNQPMEITEDNFAEVSGIATSFGIEKLATSCLGFVNENLNTENCCEMMNVLYDVVSKRFCEDDED